mgnify:CR=1 FL=1
MPLAMTLLLTALAVLAFGWAEDLAARRRPRLWPSTPAPLPSCCGGAVSWFGDRP